MSDRGEIPLASRGRFSHTTEIRKHRLEFLGRLGYEQRDIARGRFFDRYLVFVNSPELLRQIFVERAPSLEKHLGIRIAFFPIAGLGVATSEGALWQRQRKLMAPLFQPSQIARYVNDFVECTQARVQTWTNGQIIDFHDESTRIGMSIAGRTLFGTDGMSEADEIGSSLRTSMDWVDRRVNSPLMILQLGLIEAFRRTGRQLPRWLQAPLCLPGERRTITAAVATLDRRVQQMIDERRSAGLVRHDLLTNLMQARDEDDGRGMSDRQVRDEIITLFIGGHEGTSNSLAFALHFLCHHPEVYERLEAEVDALGGRAVSDADGPKLPYTLMVLKESIRLMPSTYLFGKVATETIDAGGYVMPRATDLFVSPYAMHRRPDFYPDPDSFEPERFAPGMEETRPRFAYIPFSLGPRVCMGAQFALLELQAMLASLIQRARFALEPGETLQPIASATLRPAPARARVTLRV